MKKKGLKIIKYVFYTLLSLPPSTVYAESLSTNLEKYKSAADRGSIQAQY